MIKSGEYLLVRFDEDQTDESTEPEAEQESEAEQEAVAEQETVAEAEATEAE